MWGWLVEVLLWWLLDPLRLSMPGGHGVVGHVLLVWRRMMALVTSWWSRGLLGSGSLLWLWHMGRAVLRWWVALGGGTSFGTEESRRVSV